MQAFCNAVRQGLLEGNIAKKYKGMMKTCDWCDQRNGISWNVSVEA
jgi:predicted 3-demethylubiquinone-9 3-methyltransferase (glyoxalase superfamily)